VSTLSIIGGRDTGPMGVVADATYWAGWLDPGSGLWSRPLLVAAAARAASRARIANLRRDSARRSYRSMAASCLRPQQQPGWLLMMPLDIEKLETQHG
jgi:hypothetical protein